MYGEKGNNENAKLIAEEAVLKMNETNKIRELYRIMNEMPETKKGKELRIKQEVEKEWNEWNIVLSADEVGPLVGLRFKFGETKNLSRAASELIPESEMPGMRKEIPNEETYNKYGRRAKNRNWGNRKRGAFIRIPFGQIATWESVIEGRFAYTIKINPFQRDMRNWYLSR